ncbi:MAG: alanine--tRNA ligase [Clostridia bacterium]|nr:alanine--tRNA ligase [Clostridia bacterium]
MENLGLNEIRKRFLDFFESKDHYVGKSASLIPKNDNSILIINSGMAPLKPYFAGTEKPPRKRMCTCQKCIRTGDIDNVGLTARHGTFFEMLGNFSFGDYFKSESLSWGVEFLTKVLEFPMDKLWATVYEEDDQAENIWKSLGMDPSHIVRLGKSDNFWEIGLGPCGPDSEIFYDRGEEFGCGKPDCKPGCDCDRFLEIWNHVFTQFSKEEDGSYSNLEHPNIDTGMGLERMACVMQGTDSIFDVDTIRYILNGIVEKAGVKYMDGKAKTDVSIRIITDHLRAMTFMIADGIMPSNEGRGYVLRRIIRRAARHGRNLGIKGSFLYEMSNKVMEVSGEAYPEIIEKKEYIQKIIQVEEEKFAQTIGQGEEIIKEYVDELKQAKKSILDGAKAFKLYDTYGFPIELTEEILAENGFTVDKEGFDVNMKAQKERARNSRKDTSDEAWDEQEEEFNFEKTIFTGYDELETVAKVLHVKEQDKKVKLYVDKTPFYATSGGQTADVGDVFSDDAQLVVTNVEKKDGYFCHTCEVVNGSVKEGDEVTLVVNRMHRFAVARNHTATHLLQKALREVVGTHVEQAGSSVTGNSLRFDFSHFEAVSRDQLKEVESLVNEAISRFMDVDIKEMPIAEAQKLGAMALFGEKYGDVVRVVNISDYSVELCGGTHVRNTGEIGAFKILSESGVASGVRRIEAVTGLGVLQEANNLESLVNEGLEVLKANKNNFVDRVKQLTEEVKATKKELDDFKKQAMGSELDDMLATATAVNDVKVITKEFSDYNIEDLRNLSDDIKKDHKSVAMVFASISNGKVTFLVSLTDDVVERGYHAGNIIKQVASVCQGGGGGKANMAQAGAKDPSKINEAFELAKTLF